MPGPEFPPYKPHHRATGEFCGPLNTQLTLERPNSRAETVRRLLAKLWESFPLSISGLLLSLGLLLTLQLRGAELDLLAIAACVCLLCVVALCLVASLLATAYFRAKLNEADGAGPLELCSGEAILSNYSIPTLRYLPFVQLDWEFDEVQAEISPQYQGGHLREKVECSRRGLHPGVTRRFTVSDTLGLTQVSWRRKTPSRIRVLPSQGALKQREVLRSLISGDEISDPRGNPEGDRVDMRQYQKGDPMKFILWKVYSRSGKVMVRVPERALASKPRACAYLLRGPWDEASAALTRSLLEMGMLGEEWRFGADGSAGHYNQVETALNALAESGNSEETGVQGLASFTKQAEADGYGMLLVLAPPADKELAEKVLQILRQTRLHSLIWVAWDHFEEAQNHPWLEPLSKRVPPKLESIQRCWKGQATLIERGSGRANRGSRGA